MAYKKVFLDTNVLLDYILDRGNVSVCAEKIFELCVEGRIDVYVAAHSILNMFYILRKYIGVKTRKMIMHNICDLCTVIDVSESKIMTAILGDRLDLEDHVQVLCAEECGADCIVTRDIKGLHSDNIKAFLPKEFLVKINSK